MLLNLRLMRYSSTATKCQVYEKDIESTLAQCSQTRLRESGDGKREITDLAYKAVSYSILSGTDIMSTPGYEQASNATLDKLQSATTP